MTFNVMDTLYHNIFVDSTLNSPVTQRMRPDDLSRDGAEEPRECESEEQVQPITRNVVLTRPPAYPAFPFRWPCTGE